MYVQFVCNATILQLTVSDYDDNCEVTVYSEPDCEGEKYPFDAIRSGDQCNAVPFGPYGKSVSLTCNGNPPDRK